MTIKHESRHTAEFLLTEGNGQISREAITLSAGDALPSGQVLGIKTDTGEYAPYSNAATDGTEVAVGVLYAPLPANTSARAGVAIVRLAEVSTARLTGIDAAGTADLKVRHIIVR
ncbi:head decoration protein [Verminephrobacter aporrectodeae subsp. tuberculatae]|uniref:Head decoration protein n=1 Tax=Verminephrobacter aporrectodeae subsp. tuberculatae TaxID=1110392 RepID=A0ABT3KMT8_9BURK|nr:head decoration protein [Verminephrobacter aporrectodeae]MCW5319635.1 head decoration protein [Verminephrobacter aporrectodeae subsp. tuberculatae]